MHNKLFLADGAMAVVGGRNLADEYYLRSPDANFLDFDVLATGPVVRELSQSFDTYWNSDQVYPLHSIVPAADSPQELRQKFDAAVRPELAPALADMPEADLYGAPPLGVEIDRWQFHFIRAWAEAYADPPSKGNPAPAAADAPAPLISKYIEQTAKAHSELLIVSPYFVPAPRGMALLRERRNRNVSIRIVTNALDASDEPLVNSGYQRYRVGLLRMGIELYEISPTEIKHSRSRLLRSAFSSSSGRLHAKYTLVDRETVLMGSMNLDPRSVYLNTELGVMIRSPELAQQIHDSFDPDVIGGVYRVQLKPDGTGLQWLGTGSDAGEVLKDEPGASLFMRLRLWLDEHLIPEDML